MIGIRLSVKVKRLLFGLISLALLYAVITVGFANKKFSQRKTTAKPTAALNVPAEGKTTIHVGSQPLPQTSAQFDLSRSTIAGGGGTSSAGNFKVEGTVGEPAAGTQMSNGQFSETSGFWQAVSAAAASPTPTPVPTPTPTASPIQLVLDASGPAPDQVAALDSILFVRDPFPVLNAADLLNPGVDKNTRVIVFATNLQLAQGETSSSVVVNLLDSNNQGYDVAAEDVRAVPNSQFTQVIFRLPDNLAAGTCAIKLKAHSQVSNTGTIRIGT